MAQMLIGLDSLCVPAEAGAYLGTFTFKVSEDARGSFSVNLLHGKTGRSALFPTAPAARVSLQADGAVVQVGPSASERSKDRSRS